MESVETRKDPYEIWKSQVYTWLMCWRKNVNIHTYINKNIAVTIACLIPLDLTDWCYFNTLSREDEIFGETEYVQKMHLAIWYRGPYEFIWLPSDEFYGRPPCRFCLRPCVDLRKLYEDNPNWGCNNKVCQSTCGKITLPECSDCGHFGICITCFQVASKRLNVAFKDIYLSDFTNIYTPQKRMNRQKSQNRKN